MQRAGITRVDIQHQKGEALALFEGTSLYVFPAVFYRSWF